MKFHSTRNSKIEVSASEAILQGIALDGGLFVPTEIPNWHDRLEKLFEMTYDELCFEVVTSFFEEFRFDQQLKKDISTAYKAFEFSDCVKLSKTDEFVYAELFHGKTCAFKDFALSVLPYEINAAKRALNKTNDFAILTATSGDTGKAALEAFRGQEGFKIAVLFPQNGVSAIQRKQMVSVSEENTFVFGLEGNFDDAQSLVKKMIADGFDGISVTSANSINIARLIPQVTYYFFVYGALVKSGQIKTGEKVNFSVPTGNFGNILSAYIAKEMGLPVGKLVCASNKNNILTDFFETGVYDKQREFFLTQSPSMDILISSNFERLLWFVSKDSDFVGGLMSELAQTGKFCADKLREKMTCFVAGFANEEETSKEIKHVFQEFGYLIDTHTAVGSFVARKQRLQGCTVVMSTASPFKFCSAVLSALGESVQSPNEFDVLENLQKFAQTDAPTALSSLKMVKDHHAESGSCADAKKKIKLFLEKKK